ncbi:MAG: hypothetical protein ACJAYB_000061 [Psychromonas sp.]|jgi:hypothetical protein
MSFLTKFIGGDAGTIIEQVGKVGDRLFTSDEERQQLNNQLEEIKLKPELMQAMANIESARHASFFVAGGRPALLWVSALGLFFFFPVKYAVATYLWAMQSLAANQIQEFPFSGDGLMELVGMLLGLGAMRTVEKLRGKSK